MKFVWKAIILLLLSASVEAKSNDNRFCGLFGEVYQHSVRKRILSGIPFELMGALFGTGSEQGMLLGKKSVHITYNLWDELILVRSGEKILGRFSIDDGRKELCKFLEIGMGVPGVVSGKKYRFRLLLNPMWNERMARLQIATSVELENRRLVDINWKKIAEDMPSEKVLMEEELEL